MKKLSYFLLIFFIFFINFSNSKAATQSAFDFNSSFNIGNFMASNYTRYICDKTTNQCKETKTKTEGDFATESECKKSCISNTFNYTNTTSSYNSGLYLQTFSTSTTKSFVTSNLNFSNFNLNTVMTTKPSYTVSPSSGLSGLNFFTTTTKSTTLQSAQPLSFGNFSLEKNQSLTLEKAPVKSNSLISGLLEGLGIIKPSAIDNTNQLKLNSLGGDENVTVTTMPIDTNDDYIWYNKDYAFKVEYTKIPVTYNYGDTINLRVFTLIPRFKDSRWVSVGLLFSYINEKNERVFDNIDYELYIKAQIDPQKAVEWQEDNSSLNIIIPNDIKVTDNKINIEFFVVKSPAYYAHFKIKDNDYKIWRETKKSSLFFDFKDEKNYSDFLKTNCKFYLINPKPQSNFIDGKEPYYTNFNLSVEMRCNQLLKTKNKPDPEKIKIEYTVTCPQQYNTDVLEQFGYFDKNYIKNSKDFDIDFHISTTDSYNNFSQTFELENDTLLNILKKRYAPYDYNVYGQTKRCDVKINIYSKYRDYEPIASISDYFYLNQCTISVQNEHQNWTYCTEDKNGNLLPIYVKLVFKNCEKDSVNPLINYINFDMVPKPHSELRSPTIEDRTSYAYEPWITSYNSSIDKNGQIIHTDINAEGEWKDWKWGNYFNPMEITKNMAKYPTNIAFPLLSIFNKDNSIFYLPIENRAQNDNFKIYYGSNYNCDNLSTNNPIPSTPNPTFPNEPQPTYSPSGNNTGNIITNTISNVFDAITNFFSSWFK